jgi:hypothetical protein
MGAFAAIHGQKPGEQRFQELCQALQALVDELDPRVKQNYVTPPR